MRFLSILFSVLTLNIFLCNAEEKNPFLELTPAEVAFLKDNPVIRVANEMDWPPFDYVEFGEPKGLAIDHIELIAEKAGFTIEYINGYTWAELLDLFRQNKIDIIPVLYKNEERKKFTLYTTPYYKGQLGIFTSETGLEINTIDDLSNRRVGIQTSHGSIPFIIKKNPEISLVEIHSTLDLVKLLATDELDAIIGNPLLFYHNARERQITNISLKGYIDTGNEDEYPTAMHVGIRKDLPLLHGIVQKAMDSMEHQDIQLLVNRWAGFNFDDTQQIHLSEEEIQYLKDNPVLRVSNELDYPPFDYSISGQAQGFSIDLINILAERIGLKINYVNGFSWSELTDMFQEGSLDLLHTINKTTDREDMGIFTDPYHYYKTYWVVPKETEEIKDISQLNGKTVAVGRGWSHTSFLAEKYPEIKHLEVESLEEMVKAVSTGQADAFMGNLSTLHYVFKKQGIIDLKISGWVKEFDSGENRTFHLLVQKDAPPLGSMLNKAIASLSIEDMERLKYKWFGNINDSRQLILNQDERNFMADNQEIILSVYPGNMPYQGFDEAGNFIGMAADYVSLLEERLGIGIKIISARSPEHSARQINNHEADFALLPLLMEPEYQGLQFSRSVMKANYSIATTNDKAFIDDLARSLDRTYAIVQNPVLNKAVKNRYPGIVLEDAPLIASGLDLVRKGLVYGFIEDSAILNYSIRSGLMTDVKIGGTIALENNWGFGMRRDDPALQSILQKALNTMESDEDLIIYNKWTAAEYIQQTDYTLLFIIITAAVTIIAFTVFWNLKLARAKRHTQQLYDDLSKMQNKLQVKNMELESIAVTDRLTGIFNRMKLDEVLREEVQRFSRYGNALSVVMMDIDFFKQVNDDYGHQTGDKVLCLVSGIISSNIRNSDVLGRWGGEEFMIICPETDLNGAGIIAEKTRLRLEEQILEGKIKVTGSFGVAQIRKGETESELVKRADRALYMAKNNGRNRVESE